ncbi:MAG: Gfo/Idh/MocA family oxidoreductase [Acidobacteriota bacterium]|nr:MAG: Gfo/Idh/MocA family oxidoreductase [Acidobacteriota bacterium]
MFGPFRTSRRHFLRTSAAAVTAVSAPAIVPSHALGRGGAMTPGDKISLGVIGIGSRCRYVLKSMLNQPDIQCVAIADVQASRRDQGKAMVDEFYGNQDCVTVRDFRELLERSDIDAMLIATGDRWHAPASMMAAEAGKDVYSEKPCGLTIDYCQRLDETFKRTGRVFQAGTQRRSIPNFQRAVDLAQSGRLGKVHTLYASVYIPTVSTEWLPGEPTPSPDVVDWNLWLGPAPWRPYHSDYVAGKWRGYWDFDSGCRLLDWAAHTLDICQWANGADGTMPIEFEPGEMTITCHYENGVKAILDFLETPFGERKGWIQHLGTCPVRFVGDEGWVETGDSGEIEVSNEALKTEIPELAEKANGLDVAAHSRDFFDAMRSREQTAASSTIMRRSHIACHAAALSWLLKRKLKIDPVTETFIDDREANGLRSRPARDPWSI